MIRKKTFKSLSLSLLLFAFLGTLSLNSCREQKKKTQTEQQAEEAVEDAQPGTDEHPGADEHPTQDADTTAGEHPNSGEHPSGN